MKNYKRSKKMADGNRADLEGGDEYKAEKVFFLQYNKLIYT